MTTLTQATIRSSRPTPVWTLLNPWQVVSTAWRHRDLIYKFAARDVVQTYKGTYLGIAWVAAQPLLILAVYTFLFSVVFSQTRWVDSVGETSRNSNFALMFFCGNTLFMFFADCINRSPTMLIDRSNLVQRVVFPLEILPMASAGTAFFFMMVGVGLLLAAGGLLAGIFSPTAYMLPVVFLPMLMLTLGLSWFLASLGVYIRDTRSMVVVGVQLLFFMTPVFYSISAVPERFRWVIRLNPLTTIVECGRDVLLRGVMPDWIPLLIVTGVSLLVMQIGYAWFMRTKRDFSDVI